MTSINFVYFPPTGSFVSLSSSLRAALWDSSPYLEIKKKKSILV